MLIAIIIAIFFLLAVNALLLVTQVKQPFSVYKNYVRAKHEELSGVFSEMRAGFPGKTLLDDNTLESKYMYYLYSSMLEDTAWFEEKENAIYKKTMNATTSEEAREGFVEEAALETVFQNALLLNSYPAEGEFWKYYNDHYNEEVNDAKEKAKSLNAENFLSDSVTQELLKESRIKKESIEKKAKEIMSEYIELRKKAFNKALVGGKSIKAFVEANKIVGLNELTVGPE